MLILGYKCIGRGTTYYSNDVEQNIQFLEENIMAISQHFNIVSFDNLSIRQLKMEEKVENFDMLYMGDDGEFTMYIDLVKKEFAISSVSNKRFKIKTDIKKMFQKIQQEKMK